jgi:P-type Ca2+ transporter type 2C
MKHYQLPLDQIAQTYQTNLTQGLFQKEARERLHRLGTNTLPEPPRDSLIFIFFRQFRNPLIYILIIAATIIFFLGNHADAFFISAIIIFNAIVGTIQEGRSQTILAKLKNLATSTTLIIREGKRYIIEDKDLVIGDLILLQEGQKVPADARVIESNRLVINESILTGESLPVEKNPDPLLNEQPLFEQKNTVFKGTTVTGGTGHAIVIATGLATEIGSISRTIEDNVTETPLKQDLDNLAHTIVISLFVLCTILFGIGLFIGKTLVDLLVILTALFICAIPEGLPVVFTLVLVGGVRRMASQQVLVKKLPAAESLGRAEIIIIDKTGTLTRNEMVVDTVYADGKEYTVTGDGYATHGQLLYNQHTITLAHHPSLLLLAEASSLLNNAQIDYVNGRVEIKGDPTEAAMGVFAKKSGISQEELPTIYKKIGELPFNSASRFHAGFYLHQHTLHIFIAGVPEVIFELCASLHPSASASLHTFLERGLRTLAVAHHVMPFTDTLPSDWQQFLYQHVRGKGNLIGLLGMHDAIRPEVAESIAKAHASGLRVVMATGDHSATALAVGRATGILGYLDLVMEGATLRSLSLPEQLHTIEHTNVFSRVTPQDKLLLVQLFRRRGHNIAMTGDGVNDVPSIVAADVGIAMGITGTDITKEAADLILLDDSFTHIIDAIEEGRHIFYTLRRVIVYFFSTNLGEILIITIALLANMELPLLASQILWLNLVTDGFLDVALAQEPKEPGLLRKKWLKDVQRDGLINSTLLFRIILTALPMALGSLGLFIAYRSNLAKARTITLTSMAMFQWFNAWNCRSETTSLLHLNPFSNGWLLGATALVFILQLAVVYIPLLQIMFHTVPLSWHEWLLIMIVSCSIIFIEEFRKAVTAMLTGDHNKSSL